jgi:hypothetical protein
MEAICSSETLATTYKTTERQNQEDRNAHFHCHEKLKSHVSPDQIDFIQFILY